MGLVLVTTAGLIVWIVLWATGVKGFDAFMITLAMVLVAAVGRILLRYLPGDRGTPSPPGG
jgi:hypothetical protein